LNYIDAIIIILFAWSAYRGFRRGLVLVVAAFISLILGIWGAAKFSHPVGDWLADTLNVSSPYMNLVSFTITFIIIVIGINIAAYLFSRFLDAIALGLINRLLGSFFNLLKMAFLLSVLFVILNAFDEKHEFMPEEQTGNSLLYKPVSDLAPWVFPFLRFENIADKIDDLLS
jgi:membrane protein required for colicin V production